MSIGYDELKGMVGMGKSWASERAEMALDFARQHEEGVLTDSEYNELLEDLIRTDVLDEEADDMAVKTALVGAVKGIMAVV